MSMDTVSTPRTKFFHENRLWYWLFTWLLHWPSLVLNQQQQVSSVVGKTGVHMGGCKRETQTVCVHMCVCLCGCVCTACTQMVQFLRGRKTGTDGASEPIFAVPSGIPHYFADPNYLFQHSPDVSNKMWSTDHEWHIVLGMNRHSSAKLSSSAWMTPVTLLIGLICVKWRLSHLKEWPNCPSPLMQLLILAKFRFPSVLVLVIQNFNTAEGPRKYWGWSMLSEEAGGRWEQQEKIRRGAIYVNL